MSVSGVEALAGELDRIVDDIGFSGVVRVDRGGHAVAELVAGFANRADGLPNGPDTRFGTASVTKGFTALTMQSLIDDDAVDVQLDTTLRSIVGDALPNVDPAVTIEQLMTHRSGVGDYLDEDQVDDIDEHVLGDRSVHTFVRPTDYLPLMAHLPPTFPPGERFAYNNGGFIMLSIAIGQLTGSFHDAVRRRVIDPAGLDDSGFFRSDDLPANTALGYLEDGRTNVHHLPVIGGGDGGIYLTAADCLRLWTALAAGRVLAADSYAAMTSVVSPDADDDSAYGRGFWLSPDADHVWLEGMDAGVSAQTGWIRSTDVTYVVLSNTSSGAWPLARAIVAAADIAASPG